MTVRSTAGATVKTFIWCGSHICEERDATGAIVTKRFFTEGEQRIGGNDAGNYYYSHDHLGSIREMTDSNGALQARYDYDPYGKRVIVAGSMSADFGYTGHYFHAPSDLNLSLHRAYNPSLGRWLSRDSIGETGGINLYAYVDNNPIGRWDPLGLDAIVINDRNGARHQGHSAILVGNNQTGWSYYSKDGYGPGRYGDGNNRLAIYSTFEQFYNSADATRYDRAVYIRTSLDQDLEMTTYGDSHYRESYGTLTNNCGDLINGILGAANIPGAGDALWTPIVRPNDQYDNFVRRPGWTPFPMR